MIRRACVLYDRESRKPAGEQISAANKLDVPLVARPPASSNKILNFYNSFICLLARLPSTSQSVRVGNTRSTDTCTSTSTNNTSRHWAGLHVLGTRNFPHLRPSVRPSARPPVRPFISHKLESISSASASFSFFLLAIAILTHARCLFPTN